ncbi:ATP-dependent DNA helicase RecG [Sphingorhabdus arenilitoris]|uniref:Probable DNA 3'-5' helicase RecG n=1 Tax=Sphingorhabdus arenilitoris TaxID=1490041 RepID=A0ABV8RF35_9SPHN
MRPDILNPLFAEVRSMAGIGPKLAKPLDRLKIERIKDLLYHFPASWTYRKPVPALDVGDVGQNIIIRLVVMDYKGSGSPRAPTRIFASDADGNYVTLTFFGRNGGWAKKQLPIGEERVISGKLERYGDELQMVHPDHMEPLDNGAAPALAEPIYPLSEGLTNKRLGQLASSAVENIPALPEWIEPSLLAKRVWPDWQTALTTVHRKDDEAARDRLAYDELFSNQLAMRLVRSALDRRHGIAIKGDGRLTNALNLPFDLTGAQKRTIAEIESDMAQSRPMLRLLQGDVGSGKTMVALMTLLRAVECRMQGALLAPTEILARQHFANLRQMLSGLPVNIAILTGRDKGKAREATLMGLADGSIDILVGTHAIFQEAVTYKSLAVAVIDEQHRFGVSQRLMLSRKAKGVPHLLVMTATPIPRTLALACYGEMDSSQLDELPPGRTPVETRVMSSERLVELVEGVGRHLASGKQAFWVCPLVEESENSDLAAAEQRAEQLRLRFGDKVALVHGRMKGPEKDAVMEAFVAGKTQLLVATTVIEVGVDVPNASLMIIEAADRFGLAQLHQLRGRVGRGAEKSICLLVRSAHIGETAAARLKLMRESNDGFRIAEEDMRLRGAGELLGTRQSGDSPFRVATAEQVRAMIGIASDDARLLLDRDGGLDSGARGQAARLALYLFERDAGIATLRGG